MTEDPYRAGRGSGPALDQAGEGGLAGAAVSQHEHPLAGRDLEALDLQGQSRAVEDVHVLELDHGVGGGFAHGMKPYSRATATTSS